MFATRAVSTWKSGATALALACGLLSTGSILAPSPAAAYGTAPAAANYWAYCRQTFPGSRFQPQYTRRGFVPSCTLLGGVPRHIDMSDFCRKTTGSTAHHPHRNNRGEVMQVHCNTAVSQGQIPSTNRIGTAYRSGIAKGSPLDISRYCRRVYRAPAARFFPGRRIWTCVIRNATRGGFAYYPVNLQTACHATTGRRNYRFTDPARGFVTCI